MWPRDRDGARAASFHRRAGNARLPPQARIVDELARTFRNFLYRDLFYVIAGLLILLSARRLVDFWVDDFLPDRTAILLLYVGFAYAVAIANQELWSQTPLIKTHPWGEHGPWRRSVFKRHTGEKWEPRADPDSRAVSDDPDYQRAVNIKQLGASMGTALLTSALLLAAAALRGSPGAAPRAAVALVLGLLLVQVSWLHNMRQTAFRKKSD